MSEPEAEDADVLQALAGWCDDKMTALAITTEPLPSPDSTHHVEHLSEHFDEFVEELAEDHDIQISDEASLRDAWLKLGEDHLRVHHMAAVFTDEDGNWTKNFHEKETSSNAMRCLHDATVDEFDRWQFDLSWSMAKLILKHKNASSDDESSPDSENDDEDEGEEEDSSEEEESSSEGSGSSDSEQESDEDESAAYSAPKKQKTDKED